MSIQDDIFDVEDALKNKPELEAFERIVAHLGAVESNEESMSHFINDLVTGVGAFKKLLTYCDECIGAIK